MSVSKKVFLNYEIQMAMIVVPQARVNTFPCGSGVLIMVAELADSCRVLVLDLGVRVVENVNFLKLFFK